MKQILIALVLALSVVQNVNATELNPEFACKPFMQEALENKTRIALNKVGVYFLRGTLVVAPVALGVATGYGAGVLIGAAGLASGQSLQIYQAILVGAGANVGVAGALVAGDANLIPTRKEKIILLSALFEASSLSEKDLKDLYFEEKVAETIKSEEKLRANRNLPPLTDAEKLAIRQSVPYGRRGETMIDTLLTLVNKSDNAYFQYDDVRAFILSNAESDFFCPKTKLGNYRKFPSLRKIARKIRTEGERLTTN